MRHPAIPKFLPASARLFPGIFALTLLLAAVAALACGGGAGDKPRAAQ